jgi:Gpi18-like mannosyltransferase
MKKVLLIFSVWVFAILIVNKFSVRFLSDRTSYELPYRVPFAFSIAPLLNMDGRRYLDIACNGYSIRDGSLNLRAFFPVYPILIRFFSAGCKINPIPVGIGISLTAFLAAVFVLWKMLDKKIRDKAVILLIFFPASFFFAAFYTESIFFLFSVLVFWFLDRKKIFYAAAFAAIASATRIVGLALTLPVFYEVYLEYKRNRKFHFEAAAAPLGFIIYAVYNWFSSGSLFTFITSQRHWDRPISLFAPLYAVKNQVSAILAGPLPAYDSPFVYPVIIIEFIVLLYLLAALYFSYKKIKMSYWLYMLGSIVIILFGGILTSVPRFALLLFPIYIFLAENLKGFKYILYLSVCFLGLIFMASLFLRGYWIS